MRVRTPRWATCRIRSVGSVPLTRGVVDVVRVRPGLHEPRGRHRSRRHRRAEPGHLLARGQPGECGAQRRPAVGPALEGLVARQRGELEGGRVDVPHRVVDRGQDDVVPRLPWPRATRGSARPGRPPRRSTSGARPGWRRSSPAPASGGSSPRAPSRSTVSAELVALRGRGRRASPCRRSVIAAPARRRGCVAHWSRIRVRRRRSSVIVLARPSPRTRSRVACTSSRTPGCDSSAPRRSTVIRCVSRPTFSSSGATSARRSGSVRAATQSSRAAVKTGEVKWSPSTCSTARVRFGPGRQVLRRRRELGAADLGHVLDGGDHEVLLGREVVQLGAPAHPGPLADERGRRAGVPLLDQQLDGRLEQPGPHRAGALLLRDARHRCLARHPVRMSRSTTNSQA